MIVKHLSPPLHTGFSRYHHTLPVLLSRVSFMSILKAGLFLLLNTLPQRVCYVMLFRVCTDKLYYWYRVLTPKYYVYILLAIHLRPNT